jgi:hypothetical protein
MAIPRDDPVKFTALITGHDTPVITECNSFNRKKFFVAVPRDYAPAIIE